MTRFRELLVRDKEKLSPDPHLRGGQADLAVAQRGGRRPGPHRLLPAEHPARARARDRARRSRAEPSKELITHEPLGVIANISAWNYPYFVGANVFVPALLAGNAVLYKPSEFSTPHGPRDRRDCCMEAGVPKDAFIPVIGGGTVGAELLKQPVERRFLHRLLRDRPENRREPSPAG